MGGSSTGVGGIGIGVVTIGAEVGGEMRLLLLLLWIITGVGIVPFLLLLLLLMEGDDDLTQELKRGVRLRGEDEDKEELEESGA
jgi:hypothetical protein